MQCNIRSENKKRCCRKNWLSTSQNGFFSLQKWKSQKIMYFVTTATGHRSQGQTGVWQLLQQAANDTVHYFDLLCQLLLYSISTLLTPGKGPAALQQCFDSHDNQVKVPYHQELEAVPPDLQLAAAAISPHKE